MLLRDVQGASDALKKAYEAKQNPCRHPHLKFMSGGLFLACLDCGQRYFKSIKDSAFPDWTGQFDNFTDNDKRSDPFHVPPIKLTSTKKLTRTKHRDSAIKKRLA